MSGTMENGRGCTRGVEADLSSESKSQVKFVSHDNTHRIVIHSPTTEMNECACAVMGVRNCNGALQASNRSQRRQSGNRGARRFLRWLGRRCAVRNEGKKRKRRTARLVAIHPPTTRAAINPEDAPVFYPPSESDSFFTADTLSEIDCVPELSLVEANHRLRNARLPPFRLKNADDRTQNIPAIGSNGKPDNLDATAEEQDSLRLLLSAAPSAGHAHIHVFLKGAKLQQPTFIESYQLWTSLSLQMTSGSDLRVLPDAPRPIAFETPFFEGKVLFLLRPDESQTDAQYSHIFDARQRVFEFQIQGRFKCDPRGVVYFGIELDRKMTMDWVSTGQAVFEL